MSSASSRHGMLVMDGDISVRWAGVWSSHNRQRIVNP